MNELLFLPGWGMEPSIFQPMTQLFDKQYRIKSVNWQHIKELDEYKQRVLDQLEKDVPSPSKSTKKALIGWSLGSLVALDIASSYPEKVSHLILIGGTSRFTVDDRGEYTAGWKARIVERMRRRLERDQELLLQNFYEKMFSPQEVGSGQYERFLQYVATEFQGDDRQSLQLGLDYLLQKDQRGALGHIHCPTLLIHGEDDQICPLAASLYLVHELNREHELNRAPMTKAELYTIPHSGHVPFFTQSSLCANKIVQFMEAT